MTKLFDPMIAELEQEQASTRRVLERAPVGHFNWRPHPKAMTLGQLAWHIASLPRGVTSLLKQDVVDVTTIMVPLRAPASTAELISEFEQSLRDAAATLRGMSDEQAAGNWTVTHGSRPIMTMPRTAVVRMIVLNHLYHHRGQMTTYFRCLDVPVPSVYGPTADDNPFGAVAQEVGAR